MPAHDQSRAGWRTSSHSSTNGGQCIEVAALPGRIGVRDSKNPEGARLVFGLAEWRVFMRRIRSGELGC
ncbi:DUF397 domain-containing protein [Actinomadura napierensis]|uniref:DUF397 domain-containing protein n=1 Tax=Actinomadura napierensis TaxID=267854 RepID=A0ABN2YMN0_9ACTN